MTSFETSWQLKTSPCRKILESPDVKSCWHKAELTMPSATQKYIFNVKKTKNIRNWTRKHISQLREKWIQQCRCNIGINGENGIPICWAGAMSPGNANSTSFIPSIVSNAALIHQVSTLHTHFGHPPFILTSTECQAKILIFHTSLSTVQSE